jgi:hypothetical protein
LHTERRDRQTDQHYKQQQAVTYSNTTEQTLFESSRLMSLPPISHRYRSSAPSNMNRKRDASQPPPSSVTRLTVTHPQIGPIPSFTQVVPQLTRSMSAMCASTHRRPDHGTHTSMTCPQPRQLPSPHTRGTVAVDPLNHDGLLTPRNLADDVTAEEEHLLLTLQSRLRAVREANQRKAAYVKEMEEKRIPAAKRSAKKRERAR